MSKARKIKLQAIFMVTIMVVVCLCVAAAYIAENL